MTPNGDSQLLDELPPPLPRKPGIVYDWRAFTRRVGTRVHQLRELLGLSQERLAQVAGVSQGAVSRVESGRCNATPLITHAKLFAALSRELGDIRPDALTAEVQEFLMTIRRLVPVFWTDGMPLVGDPGLGKLMTAYAALRDPEREAFLRCVLPLAAYMEGASAPRMLPLTEEGAFYVE